MSFCSHGQLFAEISMTNLSRGRRLIARADFDPDYDWPIPMEIATAMILGLRFLSPLSGDLVRCRIRLICDVCYFPTGLRVSKKFRYPRTRGRMESIASISLQILVLLWERYRTAEVDDEKVIRLAKSLGGRPDHN